ncbi:MAG TPA: DUF4118 domain-containing protein, partial [Roseiflexaceae bacterium]
MLFATRAPVREYVAALLAVIAALLLTLLLRQVLDILIFPIFLAAVMFSAWYGGLGPGLFATLLAAVATSFILVQPPYSLTVELTIATRVGTFVLAALFISSLNEASRRAAAELRRQREELRVTLASIGDAVIVADAQGRVTFANQAAQDLTGWGQSEAQGQALETIFTIVDEQTRRPVESPVDRILREGTVVGLANHTLLIARGGQEIPIDDSAAPIRDQGRAIVGSVLVFRDVTHRRR